MPAKAVLSTMVLIIVLLVSVVVASAIIPLFGLLGFVLMVCALWLVAHTLLVRTFR